MDNVYNIPQLEGLRFFNIQRSKVFKTAEPGFEVKTFRNAGGKTRFSEANANGVPMVMPLRIKLESWPDWWLLPIEPLVSIAGGNVIAKRTVAKGKLRGTIKERWTQDDYAITIQGLFINSNDEGVYPEQQVSLLREICEAREAVQVECDLLTYFDVFRIVIETYNFPFTNGENQQQYSIKAVSDDITDVLMQEEQL